MIEGRLAVCRSEWSVLRSRDEEGRGCDQDQAKAKVGQRRAINSGDSNVVCQTCPYNIMCRY